MEKIDTTGYKFEKTYADDLEKINKWSHDKISFAYSHNGANVYFLDGQNPQSGSDKKTICIAKKDKMLIFCVGETTNEVGTKFVRATVVGCPTRESHSDTKEGMYPFDIVTKDCQKEGDDVVSRAAAIYDRENPRLGEIFRSYVPDSLKRIKEQMNAKSFETDKKRAQSQAADQQRAFNALLNDFYSR